MPEPQVTDTKPISDAAIQAQLEQILQSSDFEANDRRRQMLKFIVEEALAGRASCIKATTIAMAVFGRGADFDQQTDPVVRLEARRLRYDLDHYYAGAGRNDAIRIDIPKGHYRPAFCDQFAAESGNGDEAGELEPAVEEVLPATAGAVVNHRRRSILPRLTLALATLLVGIGIALFWAGQAKDSPIGDAAAATAEPVIRVDRFKTPDEDPVSVLLATGLAHEVAASLLKAHDLRVHLEPKTQAGDNQGERVLRPDAGFYLKGSVLRQGDNLIVHAQLLRSGDGKVLWSDYFEESAQARRMHAIEDQISTHVAAALLSETGGHVSEGDS